MSELNAEEGLRLLNEGVPLAEEKAAPVLTWEDYEHISSTYLRCMIKTYEGAEGFGKGKERQNLEKALLYLRKCYEALPDATDDSEHRELRLRKRELTLKHIDILEQELEGKIDRITAHQKWVKSHQDIMDLYPTYAKETGTESFLKQAILYLEDKEWKHADSYFDRALMIDPECAQAYLGKLCVELKLTSETELAKHSSLLDEMPNFKKALRFADDEYREKINAYNLEIKERLKERARVEKEQREKRDEELRLENQRKAEEDKHKREERKPYLASVREKISKYKGSIVSTYFMNGHFCFGIEKDGTVAYAEISNERFYDHARSWKDNVHSWKDIVSIHLGDYSIIGLKVDGTVVACGEPNARLKVSGFNNIVAIGAACSTIGLKSDGTVVAAGDNLYGECNVHDWRNIVEIAVDEGITVGLKSDGTVVATGQNPNEECNVSGWTNITKIRVYAREKEGGHTVGIKTDGAVVATGKNDNGQCNVNGWSDIVDISVCGGHTVGLKTDGTVVATGDDPSKRFNVSEWRDIVAIFPTYDLVVGLKADGTVVSIYRGSLDGNDKVSGWSDIVDIESSYLSLIGVRANGTVVLEGADIYYNSSARRWNNIGPMSEQTKKWILQGRCGFCGGQLSGFFSKKCKSCGEPA